MNPYVFEKDFGDQRDVPRAIKSKDIPVVLSRHEIDAILNHLEYPYSFATHLLQAKYDIRTIQTMLGNSDVRTTMFYSHCVPSKTAKEAKSPLDF